MTRTSACISLSILLVFSLSQFASAVIVAGNYANTSDANVNTSPPTDDPGFYSVGSVGTASAIYLGTDGQGNGWVLSADHVTLGNTTFNFPDRTNPNQIDSATYNIVPNSGILLTNPSGPGAGQTSDLILYKIDPASSPYGLPNLPRLDISTSAPSLGATVTGIGRGVDRGSSITYWDSNWATTTQQNASYAGYALGSTHTMRWGDNNVAAVNVDVNVGSTQNPVYVSSFWTQFDRNGTANEFSATTGDSGGGVFEKVGGQWYLSGMIDAVTLAASNQPGTDAVFGTSTVIADLSVYGSQIRAIVPEPGSLVLAVAGLSAWMLSVAFRRHRGGLANSTLSFAQAIHAFSRTVITCPAGARSGTRRVVHSCRRRPRTTNSSAEPADKAVVTAWEFLPMAGSNQRLIGCAVLLCLVAPAWAVEPQSYRDHSKLLVYVDQNGAEHEVKTDQDWAVRRQDILRGMQQAMGPFPARDKLPPLKIEVGDEIVDAGDARRQTISFDSGDGDRVAAHLYLPPAAEHARRPAILALHQTSAIGKGEVAGYGKSPHQAYAAELAARGYVVIAPDYPSFGDSRNYDFQGDAYVSGTMKGIFNHMRAVDLLVARDDVDPARLGVIGHSLGGHNAMFVGVFDQRLKVIVSSCGWTPFHDYYGGKIEGWTSDRYMPRLRDTYNLDPDRVPFDFYEVVAALAPRGQFFSNSPLHDDNFDVQGVKRAVAEAAQVYEMLGARDRLQVRYPDCAHDFPDETRARPIASSTKCSSIRRGGTCPKRDSGRCFASPWLENTFMDRPLRRRTMLAQTGIAVGAAVAGAAAAERPASSAENTATKNPDAEPFVYGFNTSTIRGQKLTLPQEIDVVARAGYRSIEPWIREIDDYVKQGGSLADLAKRFRDGGLVVDSVIGFFDWIVDDDVRRAKGLEEARRNMEIVAAIGGTRLAAPPAGATDVTGFDLQKAAERYGELLALGNKLGVIPQVEVWGFSKTLGTLGEAAQVAINCGQPNACILADVYHLYKGGSQIEGLKLLAGSAMHVFHFNDYPADPPRAEIKDAQRVFPGDGVAPLDEILRHAARHWLPRRFVAGTF